MGPAQPDDLKDIPSQGRLSTEQINDFGSGFFQVPEDHIQFLQCRFIFWVLLELCDAAMPAGTLAPVCKAHLDDLGLVIGQRLSP